MDMATFKNMLEKNHWKDCLMAIIFDNSMRWVFDHRERHYNKETGKMEFGDYVPPEEMLIFDDENECIKLKERYIIKDVTHPLYDKAYFYTVRHVENVQATVFCDLDNKEIRPFFDVNMM